MFVTTTLGCVSLDGLSDESPPGSATGTSAVVAAKTCAAARVRVRDGFEGRKTAAASGWSKGRVSDGLPVIVTPDVSTTAVLSSRVTATADDKAKSTAYVERELPATGCVSADFMVSYTEAAAFPDDAWTYFFWMDAADDLNVSLFRMGKIVRIAAQRGGSELERIDVDLPPGKWTRLKVEVDLAAARPTVAITVGDAAAQRMTLAEPLAPPYFVSFGTWSRGAVPAHTFFFDDVAVSY